MRTLLICLLALLPVSAFADFQDPKAVKTSYKCQTTPSITQKKDGYPGRNSIVSSNNLALPAGKSVYAKGQQVHIYGHILDKNCVPVSDAIVEIWQVDTEGKPVKSKRSNRLNPYPEFAGSGRAITNNLGEFKFITLFPGQETASRTPYIHFRVIRKGFKTANTQMFFAGDNRNGNDTVLKKLSDGDRDALLAPVTQSSDPQDNSLVVNWDIVLDGVNKFRKY